MLCTPHQTSTYAGDQIKQNESRRFGGEEWRGPYRVVMGILDGERPQGRPRCHSNGYSRSVMRRHGLD